MHNGLKRSGLSAEMITAFTAVIIGVGAIGVSVYETTLVRQQLKGSAWPNVEVGFTYNDEGFRYFATNSGVGPARLGHARVTIDGEPVADWSEFFERLELRVGRYLTSYIARGVMAPGAVLDILALEADQPVDALYRLQHRVGIGVCYCSVYDDCWTKAAGEEPVPVRDCAVVGEQPFGN
jgi:hypothetical protein